MIITTVDFGRLTADPDVRTTTTGRSYTSFTIASDTGRKDAQGNKISNFVRVTSWGKEGENVAKFLHKGDPISVTGLLSVSMYKSKDGEMRLAMDLDAKNITFHPREKRSEEQEEKPAKKSSRRAQQQYEEDDEDPFA